MTELAGFELDCQTSVGALRAALMELYATVGASPDAPQDVSRNFDVNKNLTWKLAKIIATPATVEALQHLPGAAGMAIFLRAMARAGAGAPLVERVRTAYDEVEHVVQVHVGDRSTLELVLDGQNPNRAERLEVSRKIAFRGNSGVWGVQAKAKVTLAAMAPSPSGDQLDIAFVRGFIGFRRLRSELSWPISIRRDWSGEGDPFESEWEPIEPDQVERGLPLMRRFTTDPAPEFELQRSSEGLHYVLPPGPVGNTAAFDCFFGDISRGTSARYRGGDEHHGEFVSAITTPVEYQLLDVILHEDLAEGFDPEVLVCGDPFGTRTMASGHPSHCRLPIEERAYPMPGSPPMVATPLYRRYPEIVARVYERMGWDPRQFRGVRLQLKYPPMGTFVSLRFDLPERPA